MALGKPMGHPITSAVSRTVSHAPHTVGGTAVAPNFSVLTPNADGTISTELTRGVGSPTFARASVATSRDWENRHYEVVANEARFQGTRYVKNVLIHSENIDNRDAGSWITQAGCTSSQDAGYAPDGSYTAGKLTFNNQYGNLEQSASSPISTAGQVGRATVWIKRISGNYNIWLRGTSNATAYQHEITITDDWQEYSIKDTCDGINPFGICIQDRNASGQGEILIWHPQVEDVTGQSDQTPGPYVATGASAVSKHFYDCEQYEVVDNRVTYSHDLTQWLGGSIASYDSETKISTVVDGSASSQEAVYNAITIPDDSNTHTFAFRVKKKATPSVDNVKAGFYLNYYGGTGVGHLIRIDLYTGFSEENTYTDGSWRVYDDGEYWKVEVTLTNNSTGNTTLQYTLYPAVSHDGGGVSATQTIEIQGAQLSLNTAVSYENIVETTGSLITNVVKQKTKAYEEVAQLLRSTDVSNATYWQQIANVTVSGADAEGYYTVTDPDTALNYIQTQETIADDSEWYSATMDIKKDPSASAWSEFQLLLTGGTTNSVVLRIDLRDETTNVSKTTSEADAWIQDRGTFFRVNLAVKNNASGNTTLTFVVLPARGTSHWSNDNNATGSCEVRYPLVQKSRIIPSDNYVATSGEVITLYKETSRSANLQLHPTVQKASSSLFANYDKHTTSTAYSVGDHIVPDTGSGPAGGNGYWYECIVAGTSGGTAPTFGTTVGDGTHDNGVVWKCMGRYTVAGYLSEGEITNQITYSYDLTNWTQTGTAVSALDAIGLFGVANTATTLTDNDGAGFEYVNTSVTIPDDSNTHTVSLIFDKDSDTSRYVGIDIKIGAAATQWAKWDLDTANGTVVDRGSVGTTSAYVIDLGTRWFVVIQVTNDSTGQTSLVTHIYPAVGTVQGTASPTATGSCVVSHVQVELNTSAPTSPIVTNGATAARNRDTLKYNAEDNFNNSEGTVVVSIHHGDKWFNASGYSRIIAFDAGSNHGTPLSLSGSTTANGGLNCWDETNDANWGYSTYSVDPERAPYMAGSRWNSGGKYIGGFGVGTESSETYDGDYWESGSLLQIGGGASGDAEQFYGCLKNILIFNKDLGATKLQAATAYD